MQVHLTNAGAITLREPGIFNRLEVLVDPQTPERLGQAIARIGNREDEGHVRLSPSVLRFLSGHVGEPGWEQGFAAMLTYAESKGWTDDKGNVRAHLTFQGSDEVVSQAEFKSAMRALPAGICAVTSGSGDEVAGMIVSSFTSISAEPPMVGFFVHQDASILKRLQTCERFVANVLGEEHREVMGSFLSAPQGPARFAQGAWAAGEHQLPVLSDALASTECDIVWTQILGTHTLVVGKIRKSSCTEAKPVVHFNSATHGLAPSMAH